MSSKKLSEQARFILLWAAYASPTGTICGHHSVPSVINTPNGNITPPTFKAVSMMAVRGLERRGLMKANSVGFEITVFGLVAIDFDPSWYADYARRNGHGPMHDRDPRKDFKRGGDR